ncbi:chromate transporter [Synechococcus sp. CBW1004]|uniref:chromate transporter n=1 Tax=Synechococcus sp. CBW1004 TaxID=1353136 RepID=UPI001E65915C|nr:chromate transporter [Synechococcus sp. CBW1004]
MTSPPTTPAAVSLAEASRFWLRLGLVSFGGPAGQIALLHEELVERRRWLSERRFLHALNYCMLLPGPEATQLATYLGWLMHGTAGGLIAGGLFLLPAILMLLALASAYALWGHLPLLSALFAVLQPTVLAIVLQAAWRLGRRTLHTPFLMAIAAAAFASQSLRLLPYPLLVVLVAFAGALAARFRSALVNSPAATEAPGAGTTVPVASSRVPDALDPVQETGVPAGLSPGSRTGLQTFSSPPSGSEPTPSPPSGQDPASPKAGGAMRSKWPTASDRAAPAALHGDRTPSPPHVRFRRRALASTLLIGGMALMLPLLALTLLQGWGGILPTMARFFTRVALVSFGGAYAVLPYVAEGAVQRFDWLSAPQMVDALALGETTPGPLIMVVAFVGFLGGWNQAGSLSLAVAAALVVIWFTFLPSFLFILAGAPLVEASRGDLRLDGPLRAITAAVVGVIASLALLFSGPVLWPAGQGPWPSGVALTVLLLGLALLLRWHWSVLRVIGLAVALGLLRALLQTLLT